MRRRAFTLVEMAVAVGLFLAVSVLVHTLLVQSRRQEERLRGGLGAEQDLRLRMLRITWELQESTRILHPVRYGETRDGVGFVTPAGEAVFYWVADPAGASATPVTTAAPVRAQPVELWRTNLTRRAAERILANVDAFRVTLYPAVPGKEPSCACLRLSVLEKPRENDARTMHAQLTRVFVRNLERVGPDS